MRKRSIIVSAAIILTLAPAACATAATTCESLASLSLPQATVTMAAFIAPGSFIPPASFSPGPAPAEIAYKDLPAFCRIAATLRPSSDSEIKIEVWLPQSSAWDGKFMAVGNGGTAGQISYNAMGLPLTRGYAVASTDTGHEGKSDDASFAMGHPEKEIDFAYRAVHEMTVKAKAMIAAFYGQSPRHSYWNGCSTGGRQGLTEAQRFPTDFDGVIAGAPGNNPRSLVQRIWIAQAVHKDEASYIPAGKYPLIHKAVLDACDADDGVKDGVLEDPTRCKFDPKVLECKSGDDPGCLTTPQVEAVRKIYGPSINPRTKKQIFPGFAPGSELGWGFAAGPEPAALTLTRFQYVVFKNPNWDYRTFDFDHDLALYDRAFEAEKAMNPNLKPFFDHGGKLLQYHGWSDNLQSPLNSVNYHQSIQDALGGANKVRDSYRLFMVPGMGHCAGGEGPNRFDAISALEQWVEKGNAPDSIVASHNAGQKVDRTRPLCPYPKVAKYKGTGSTDEAANFSCVQNK